MKKWFRRKFLEFRAWIFRNENEERNARYPLEDKLDDYADAQIAMLLAVSNQYKKAKKNPDDFVEKYFSAKIEPIKPYVDSWIDDWREETLTLSWEKKDDEEYKRLRSEDYDG
jgi:hypothetical protein